MTHNQKRPLLGSVTQITFRGTWNLKGRQVGGNQRAASTPESSGLVLLSSCRNPALKLLKYPRTTESQLSTLFSGLHWPRDGRIDIETYFSHGRGLRMWPYPLSP